MPMEIGDSPVRRIHYYKKLPITAAVYWKPWQNY
jgi:hypothetical protein